MAERFSIEPQGLRDSGHALDKAGNELDNQRQSLESAITGSDSVWGTDEVGGEFGRAYRDVVAAASEVLASAAAGIADIGSAVRATADHTAENDCAAEDQLKRLLEALS